MEVLDSIKSTASRTKTEKVPKTSTSVSAFRFKELDLVTNEDSDVEFADDDDVDLLEEIVKDETDGDEDEESSDDGRDESHYYTYNTNSDWQHGVTTPECLPFTGKHGLQVEMEDTSPLGYLRLMINDEMMQEIVTETNRYAADSLKGKHLGRSSRFRRWVDVTIEEMWAFFGLIIAMGLICIRDIEEYWSTDPVYDLPLFRSVMPRERFCLILSLLHVCDNREYLPSSHPDHDPLFKIRSFVTHLNGNLQRAFKPGKKVTVEEAMVSWRGPLAFKVQNAENRIREDIKVFQLCDSLTGYCSALEFYTGKQEASRHGAPFDIVKRLISPYLGCGRTLFVSRYYTSTALFTYLKNEATLACGTLHANQRCGPRKEMLPKLTKGDPPTCVTNGELNLLRFYDAREVQVLTTAHDDSTALHDDSTAAHDDSTVVISRTNTMTKLAAGVDYNRHIGVHRGIHMVACNSFTRRSLKWWKKAFFHMFMLGVINAFIVHKATEVKKLTQRIFRRELAKQLIQMCPVQTDSSRPMSRVNSVGVGDSSLLRLSARHFPAIIKGKPGNKVSNPQRVCVVCNTRSILKKSRYECPSCNVGLHVVPCFQIYHTKVDFRGPIKRKLPE